MLILLTRLIKDDRGVTAIEYGLIAALIAVGALVAINSTSLSLVRIHKRDIFRGL
jgi:pilus assembly protein Flp/PilA